MDLAILATLMRPGAFPPHDPWLAGHALPYYYWGFIPWVLPVKLLGLLPDQAFNLLVPLLAALTAQAAWALARRLGGGERGAIMAALLVVFAGTPDGWRQLLAGRSVAGEDLWASSRQISGTITEFPLFSWHLGDLHPHVIALPLVLTAMILATTVATRGRPILGATASALVFGAGAAANPWYAVPVGAAVGLMIIAPPEGLALPWGRGLRRWLLALAVGAGGWLLFAPFWLHFGPPLGGFGLVRDVTRWDQLALFLGAMLLVPLLVGWELSWRWGGLNRAVRQLLRAFWLATAVLVSALSGSLGLGLSLAITAVLAAQIVRGGNRPLRQAWALAAVPLGLIAAMELFYLRDPYGGELYRMNTVFKASFLAFVLLAVTVPVMLRWLVRRRRWLGMIAAGAVLVAGLPQLAALAGRIGPPPGRGWDGLAWMAPGEADTVHWLFEQAPGTVLLEAVGDAYTDAARLSAASGVPTVLGWENHERVWRGSAVDPELRERRKAVARIYTCGDPQMVARDARALGADLIAVGSVERRLYPRPGLEAVLRAGEVAFASEDCEVVRVER